MGSQTPSVRICPKYEYTDGKDAVKILSYAGLDVDPWQDNVLCDWMGKDENDRWASPTCGLSVPRQNGKTCDVSGRAGAGMMMYSEWIIYTAHLQKTSTETFLEIKSLFESKALRKYVKEIRSALGREQILLNNGARIQFVARSRNSGRGLHGDCLIFDEAQELTSEQQASLLPALAASKNPQTIYLGTPPDENCQGEVFSNIRERAISGKNKRTAWTEFSVDEIGDVTDRTRWAKSNPAMGRRILESTIASECEQMDEDTFARERLGWWSKKQIKLDYVINRTNWDLCKSSDLKPDGKTAYSVKFSHDGTEVLLCGCVIRKDGTARISEIKREQMYKGTNWLANWLNERYKQASCVVIDGKNGTELLIDKIADVWISKGSIIKPKANDIISATTLLTDAINEKKVDWYELQDDLDNSAKTSIKRPINGGYGFGGENPLPIETCALAFYGAKTCKRDPSKKMRIG